jgi:hypothetical protein
VPTSLLHLHVFERNYEGTCMFLPPPPLLHPHSSKKSKIKRGRHVPILFTFPCSYKKLEGAKHVPTPYLAFECILQEMGGREYVLTSSLHSRAFKKNWKG